MGNYYFFSLSEQEVKSVSLNFSNMNNYILFTDHSVY